VTDCLCSVWSIRLWVGGWVGRGLQRVELRANGWKGFPLNLEGKGPYEGGGLKVTECIISCCCC